MSSANNVKPIRCTQHGDCPGYVACVHVMEGARVGMYDRPEDDETGTGSIICAQKSPRSHSVDELHLVCEECATARGWIPPRAA